MDELPEILILGKNTVEKGNSFELFLKSFLAYQGYINIESERHTAMQIDFTATHNLSKTKIMGEAKGYKKNVKVKNNDVLAFRSKVELYKERHNLSQVQPYFITSSDFTWEIKDQIDLSEFLSDLVTINGRELIERLIESRFIPQISFVDKVIKEIIPFVLKNKYIIIFNGEPYWLQTFNNEVNEEKYFNIFNKTGEIITHIDIERILEALEHKEIKSLVLIDLDVRYNIIEFLLNKGESNEEEISNELKLSLDTIKMNLDSLNVYEKLIFKSNNSYSLTSELEGFRHLFNIIYKSDNPKLMKAFYLSNYLSEMLNHRLMNYICSRFFIENLEDKLEEQLKILISLFPEALSICLNANTTFFQNVAEFHNKSTKKKQIGDLNLLLYRFLLQNLHTGILIQYFKNQNMVHSILQEKGLMDHAIYSNIVMIKGFERYLDFQGNYIVGFRKFVGKGPIKSGSFVTTTNKEQLVNEMAKLIGLKNYDGVIEETDKFLAEPSLEILKPQFLINKGVAFTYLQKNTKAIEIYEEALEFDEQLPTIYVNLFRAWYNKYKLAIENQKDYPIVPIYLLRYLDNAKINLEKFKTLELDEKDREKFKNIEKEEERFNTDFNSFYEQCLKGMAVNEIPFFLALVAFIDEEYLELIYSSNPYLIESLIEKEPNEMSLDNWNYLAVYFRILGQNEKALIAITKGIEKLDGKGDIFALSDTKGEIFFNLGNYEEALKNFNKILDISEDDIRVKHFYAETCWKAAKTAKEFGDFEKFKDLRNKALKLVDTHCKDERIKKKILDEFSN